MEHGILVSLLHWVTMYWRWHHTWPHLTEELATMWSSHFQLSYLTQVHSHFSYSARVGHVLCRNIIWVWIMIHIVQGYYSVVFWSLTALWYDIHADILPRHSKTLKDRTEKYPCPICAFFLQWVKKFKVANVPPLNGINTMYCGIISSV